MYIAEIAKPGHNISPLIPTLTHSYHLPQMRLNISSIVSYSKYYNTLSLRKTNLRASTSSDSADSVDYFDKLAARRLGGWAGSWGCTVVFTPRNVAGRSSYFVEGGSCCRGDNWPIDGIGW